MNVIDIDTSPLPALVIKDDKQLTELIFDMASKQLVLNAAETEQQAKLEAVKKAFADATGGIVEDIRAKFAAVEAYAAKHKDRLFPVKGGKRKKTFPVLSHKLQYRSSEQVKAPADVISIIQNLINRLQESIESQKLATDQGESFYHAEQAFISTLRGLIRQPEPELNKDAVKAISDNTVKDYLAAHGITVETLETFKLAFAFSPEQAAN